jgi:GTP pyrophosphokinase
MEEEKNPGIDDVIQEAGKYIHDPKSIALIEKAVNYAAEHHAGQFRRSGEPYIIHLTNVAYILATLQAGPSTIAAGFLHDVIEDCGVSHDQLAADFDEEIADLVEAVTKIGTLQYKGKDDPEYQAANHRKIFIAMAKDVRVILIKLVDRLHNMRTLQYQPEAAQKRIASETLDVYAPIAHRLGISSIKNELEDLCFYYLNRQEYYRIAHLVDFKKDERDAAVNRMIEEITELLNENHIEFRIFGRSKHLYSIYKKMVKKHKRFDQILDLLAIRIVTNTELSCYEILGYIHAKYKPIPSRLKDYIAVPKPNMYQSLHTTIIGDDGRIFEVQIRTEEMDEVAERGVAAHWRYKEGTRYDARKEQKEIEDKLSWFKNFATYSEEESSSASASASEYMATLQHDVFEANVYVMTPKGRVVDLVSGATPIDFAYRVHTDVGHTCVGAVVNGVMVPLNTELHTGDVVEIKTRKGSGPSEDWLKVVKTNQAKNKIRAYLTRKETEKKEELVPEGEKILKEELTRRGFDAKEFLEKKRIESVSHEFRVSNYTDFMYGIAVHSISPVAVCEKLTNAKARIQDDETLQRVLSREKPKQANSETGLIVPGIESMKMAIAKCCLPVYGDPIVGFVTKGEGVRVHRADCPNVKAEGAHLIDVEWDSGNPERTYACDIMITAEDRSFLVTDILTCVSQYKAPMETINAAINHETLTSTIRMTLRVHNVEHVNNVIANIRKIESVITVEREMH